MSTVYIAGPDVFRPDARAFFTQVRQRAQMYGFLCLTPEETSVAEDAPNGPASARRIFAANCEMVRRADLVVANLAAFRGFEPDSGTLFEVGMAYALGTPVILYAPAAHQTLLERARVCGLVSGSGHVDEAGWAVEDFGLPFNLMANCAATVVVAGDVFDALDCAARMKMQAQAAARSKPIEGAEYA